MKKKIIGIIICMMFVGTVLPVTGNVLIDKTPLSLINGNTLYVGGDGPGNYSIIQDAIDNASDGDTVFVYSGTYYEGLDVDKSLTLIGENKYSTIIHGKNESYTTIIHSNNKQGITVKDFTLCNASVGIWTWITCYHVFDNNIIRDCDGPAMTFHNNKEITITNNFVINTTIGLDIGSFRDGLISGNSFQCNHHGMYISGKTRDNIFKNNIIFNGVYSAITFHLEIYNNTFLENTIYGRIRKTSFAEIENNLIYHNNFFGPVSVGTENYLDNGKEGNYWCDYRGIDKNGDGIGDTPYPDKEYDKYPLMKAYGIESTPPDKPILYGPTNGTVRKIYEFTVVTTDPDGDLVRYLFDWSDYSKQEWSSFYNSNEEAKEIHNWWRDDTYNIRVKARDFYGFESEWSDPLQIIIPRTKVTLSF